MPTPRPILAPVERPNEGELVEVFEEDGLVEVGDADEEGVTAIADPLAWQTYCPFVAERREVKESHGMEAMLDMLSVPVTLSSFGNERLVILLEDGN